MTSKKRRSAPLDRTAGVRPGRADLVQVDSDGLDLVRGHDGRAFLRPSALREVPPFQEEAISRLQGIARQILRLDEELEVWVEEARDRGLSWDSIGWCLGVTGSAVRQRYSD